MYTSYFANMKNVANPLSISLRAPEWYDGPEYKKLAPKYKFLMAYKAGLIDAAEYTRQFNEQVLSQLNAQEVWDELTSTYGEDVTLLCYEAPGDFCHRRLVADWFKQELGYDVSEYRRENGRKSNVLTDDI